MLPATSSPAVSCSATIRTRFTFLVPALGLLACGGDSNGPPNVGTIQAIALTTGSGVDPDGYQVTVDAGVPASLGTNAAVTLNNLLAGDHTVTVSNLAPGCTVLTTNPLTVAVSIGTTVTADFRVSCGTPGQILFRSVRSGLSHIFVMNADGSNIVDLTPAQNSLAAQWSPDGSKIAFETSRDGNFEVYVMDADASNALDLTNTPEDEFDPVWSPDGSEIAFSTAAGIYRMNASGSGVTPVLAEPGTDASGWSPDGALIALTKVNNVCNALTGCGRDILTVQPDGGGLTPLTHSSQAALRGPAWSRDGLQLAFLRSAVRSAVFPGAGPGIEIMNADGSNRHALVAGESAPVWSPDGNVVATTQAVGAVQQIVLRNAAGGSAIITDDNSDDVVTSWK